MESALGTAQREKDAYQDQTTVSPFPVTHLAPQSFRTSHLSKSSATFAIPKAREHRALTWAVETPARGDIEHGPGDGEQNPPAVVTAELGESARGIGRVEQRRSVGTWHPRVASFEF